MSARKGSALIVAVIVLVVSVIIAVLLSVVFRDEGRKQGSCVARHAERGDIWVGGYDDEARCQLHEYLFDRGAWLPTNDVVPSVPVYERQHGISVKRDEASTSCDIDKVIIVPTSSSVWEQVDASLERCRLSHLTPHAVSSLSLKQPDINTVQPNFRAILKANDRIAQMWPMDANYYVGYVDRLVAGAPYGTEQIAFWEGVCYAAEVIMDAPMIEQVSAERLDLLSQIGIDLAERYQLTTIAKNDLSRLSRQIMGQKGFCDAS